MSANMMPITKRQLCASRRWSRWRKAGLNEQAMASKRIAIELRLGRIIDAVHRREAEERRIIRFKGMDPR